MTFETQKIGDCVSLPNLSKYIIKPDGDVLTLWSKKPRILKGGTDKDGYKKFVLIDDDGKRQYFRRAAMVCTAFFGNRPDGMTVRHRDGTRTNDAKNNISWATQSDNCKDKLEHGTVQRGVKNGNTVITEEQTRRIKSMDKFSASYVAREVGCAKHIVHNIRNGNSWKWL